MDTHSRDPSLLFSLLLHFTMSVLLQKRVCSFRSKFFPVRVDPFLENSVVQGSQQDIMKVSSFELENVFVKHYAPNHMPDPEGNGL